MVNSVKCKIKKNPKSFKAKSILSTINNQSNTPFNNSSNQTNAQKTSQDIYNAVKAIKTSQSPQKFIILNKDDSIYSSCNKNNILALKINDNKCFNLLSTIHRDNKPLTSVTPGKSSSSKPECLLDYRKYMRGVDVHDQYLSYNPLARKYKKLYKKIFFY